MLITRKIGSLIRGKASPFQIYAACLLGCGLGFLPGFEQAPFLVILWSFLLLVLNANLFLAGVMTLFAKLVFLVAMPVVFSLGRFLLEGPIQGLFKAIVNAPVGAYSGFDYYVVAGGQLAGLIVGLLMGFSLSKALNSYRRKMANLTNNSEKLKAYSSRGWAKTMKWLFIGSGRGKKTYEELMAVRVGNPIRIWGLAVVLILCGGIAVGYNALSSKLITSIAKSNLEKVNGATVDLESFDLRLSESSLEISGLGMADPQNLNTNLFQSKRIVADVSTSDLLRKRFSVDRLVFEDAATGLERSEPGALVGPSPKSGKAIELPEFDNLDGVLENADLWKERLAQVKKWIEEFSADGGDGEAEGERSLTWEEELNSRIRSLGYAFVKADFLTEGSPALWIKAIEAKGINTPYLDGAKLDLTGADLSTHPELLEAEPRIDVISDNGRFDFALSLGGLSGVGKNQVKANLKAYPVDGFSANLKSSGEPPLSGGTMDIAIDGSVDALDSDLVANVSFKGTSARIGGNPVSLDGVTLPVNIRGPMDSPSVRLDPKALEKVLMSAGKKRLLDEATKKLGIESDGENNEPKNLLRGLLNKKLGE